MAATCSTAAATPASSSDNKYAILMETSGKEFESWYNFILYNGNEEALQHLQKQLEKVDFFIIDDMSTFDLDLDYLVSEQTALELCHVDLNPFMRHRKFDGKLKRIDFRFSKRDDNEDKIEKVYNVLGMGDIENFIDKEYLLPGDSESDSSDGSDEDSDGSDSDRATHSDADSDADEDLRAATAASLLDVPAAAAVAAPPSKPTADRKTESEKASHNSKTKRK